MSVRENCTDERGNYQGADRGKYPYVYVDGIYLRRNWGGEHENVAILVAIAVAKIVAKMLKAIHAQESKRS